MSSDKSRRSVMAPSLPLRADGVPGAMRRLRRALARLAAVALGRPHAAARAGRIDLSGRLACLSFTEVVGVLAASRRGGTLTLRTPRGRGEVLFHDGAIVHADFDRMSGHEAIFALMREEHGTFCFRNEGVAVERLHRTVTWGPTALLMEGARRIDEQLRAQAQPAGQPALS